MKQTKQINQLVPAKVILDADSIIYTIAIHCENGGIEDIDEAVDMFHGKVVEIGFDMISAGFNNDCEWLIFGGCKKNYRKNVYKSYKANRTQPKPKMLSPLYEALIESGTIISGNYVETDDLVAAAHKEYYYSGRSSVIVAIDKDFNQIPGLKYNYLRKEFTRTTEQEAFDFFIRQMVIGDSSDGVNFIKGRGAVWCNKNLDGKSNWGKLKTVYSLFKELYKSKARERFIQCYLLLRIDANGSQGIINKKQED